MAHVRERDVGERRGLGKMNRSKELSSSMYIESQVLQAKSPALAEGLIAALRLAGSKIEQ